MNLSKQEYDLIVEFKNGRNSHVHTSDTKEELLEFLEKFKKYKSSNPKVFHQQSITLIVVKAFKDYI